MPKTLTRSRSAAFSRQSGRCWYCDLPMWLDHADGFRSRYPLTLAQARLLRCTAEHLRARQDGGGNAPDNIVAACQKCNQTRHYRKNPPDPGRHRQRVRARVKQGRWHPPAVLKALGESLDGIPFVVGSVLPAPTCVVASGRQAG